MLVGYILVDLYYSPVVPDGDSQSSSYFQQMTRMLFSSKHTLPFKEITAEENGTRVEAGHANPNREVASHVFKTAPVLHTTRFYFMFDC